MLVVIDTDYTGSYIYLEYYPLTMEATSTEVVEVVYKSIHLIYSNVIFT